MDFAEIYEAIRKDEQNASYTQRGIDPLYSASATSRIVIIGQAPGRIAEATHVPWNDRSGERLRGWLGMEPSVFYDPSKVAILPLDFYFPGRGKSGDLPPRAGFAEKWHPLLLSQMPEVRLLVLVGTYATHHYLELPQKVKLTDIVRSYEEFLPRAFPLVHPSPRNQIWMKKNPWFEAEIVPALQEQVHKALA